MLKLTILALASLAITAQAQSPSGLLTGPVTYTSTLTSGNPYGDKTVWTVQNADGTTYTCSAAGMPSCYVVPSANVAYGNLQASDGTSNGIPFCYTWNYWQLIMNDVGYCQTTYHGGGSGETRVGIYCQSNISSSDTNGTYSFNAIGSFDGTAPETTLFAVSMTAQHHSVTVWIPPHFRSPGHWATWQQIDSMAVTVTPPPSPSAHSSNVDGGPDDGK